ncbi:MAG: hypothetical protein DIU71_15760 [Proteobacteria bacterium]|nr:MAG: hypothetical protein DIU71_15760 [Pseudomonadota bacterium]
MKKLSRCVLGMVLAGMSALALAYHCPMDMKQIDEALSKNPSLSAEQLAEVKQLRAEGEAQHKAGDHASSVETLAKAKQLLGI